MDRVHFALRLVSAISFIVLTGVFPLVVGPTHRISRETYGKIRLGMSPAEVESLLGVPPGDYGVGKGWVVDYGITTAMTLSFYEQNPTTWLGETMAIQVVFDKTRGATGIAGGEVFREADSVPDWLLRQVRLRPKKSWPVGVWWMTSLSGETKSPIW